MTHESIEWRHRLFLVSVSWLLCAGLAFYLLLAGGCAKPASQGQAQEGQKQEVISEEEGQEPKVISKEDAQKIVVDFLRNSPTFRFDGMEDTLKLVRSGAGEKPYSWEFHYEFQSRHAGYGDRTGLILAQVITDHEAQIVVEQGEVVYAILDGRWDELRQRIIG